MDDLRVTYAIATSHGKVNWDYLGDLLEYVFYDELKVDPINHPVCIPLFNSLLPFLLDVTHGATRLDQSKQREVVRANV